MKNQIISNDPKESKIVQPSMVFNKPKILVDVGLNKELNVKQKKIYGYVLREFFSLKLEDFERGEVNISLSGISRFLGIQNRNHLLEDLRKLRETTIYFISYAENDVDELIPLQNMAGCIGGVSYIKDETLFNKKQTINVRFDPDMTKELKKIKGYVNLDILEYNRLQMSYSITLYEYFLLSLSGNRVGNKNYSENELRVILSIGTKYQDTKEFTKFVVKKSIDDINKNTLLHVEYKRVKDPKTKENIYRFSLKHAKHIKFPRFKEVLLKIVSTHTFEFTFKKKDYMFWEDQDTQSKNDILIVDIKKFNNYQEGKLFDKNFTVKSEKAHEIFEYLYSSYIENGLVFVNQFILNNSTNFKMKSEDIPKEELEDTTKYLNMFI